MRTVAFLTWETELDICGETATLATPERTLDLTVVPRADGRETEWEVIEGIDRIASGYESTVDAARRAAVSAARRALFRAVT